MGHATPRRSGRSELRAGSSRERDLLRRHRPIEHHHGISNSQHAFVENGRLESAAVDEASQHPIVGQRGEMSARLGESHAS